MEVNSNSKLKHLRLDIRQDGFSLVELLIAFGIVVITLAGVTASFRTFTKHSSTSLRENEKSSAIESAFQLLKRDLNMAGFGLASENRIAEDDQFETAIESDLSANYDCNNDGDSDDPITEICYSYDLDGDGTLSTAGSLMYRDRLYIADGWSILEDITDNGAYDGNIVVTSTTDYYYKVATKKEEGGYFAQLTADLSAGETSLSVDNVNINFLEEATVRDDFKSDTALILCGQDSSGNYSLEGVIIGAAGSVSGSTISFAVGENNINNFDITGPLPSSIATKVVPAVVWYVEQKTGDNVPWLYRNQDKVLPGVIGFQASFGYDAVADGLQWFSSVPPALGSAIDTKVAMNSNFTEIVGDLKATRLVLTLLRKNNGSSAVSMNTYEKTIILKN